eukprot:6178937-Pleurochrysis_carterae.AAC.2
MDAAAAHHLPGARAEAETGAHAALTRAWDSVEMQLESRDEDRRVCGLLGWFGRGLHSGRWCNTYEAAAACIVYNMEIYRASAQSRSCAALTCVPRQHHIYGKHVH